ncbi:DUF4411 family protein [Burkholderia cenocepacia]|nr:DUF4411 family protein [Burkholderia cenocepacia]
MAPWPSVYASHTNIRIGSHAAKIPNVCAHFEIPCIDLEEFMHQQDWQF